MTQIHKLKNCQYCGSEAEIDWSGATEFTFGMYQSVDVNCSNHECWVSVSIEVETGSSDKRSNAEELAVNAWNSLVVTDKSNND